MSFPDPTPPHPFMQPPFACGDADGIRPPYFIDNVQPDLISQFDRHPPYKRARNSENRASKFSPSPPMNQTNVPGGNGTCHIFYKTRICAKFMDGMCRNGDHCTFAHGAEDLREPPSNWQDLIREKDRGTGGNWSDDQRMTNRTKICKKYYNGEECPYGEKCIFLHERPVPRFKTDVRVPWERENSAISIGTRRNGVWSSSDFDQYDSDKQVSGNLDNYQVRTEFWKTKLCSKWEIGQCPFGDRCHYAHGQSDLVVSTGFYPAKSIPAAANPVIASPFTQDGEDKKTLKWKLSKKINRIYADWIDDLSPPYCSPNKEEEDA